MRGLRALQLPQLVEARRKRESSSESSDLDLQELSGSRSSTRSSTSSTNSSPLHLSHSSISSDLSQSPVSSIFTSRSHSRITSSKSSLASSPNMRESLDGYMGKRPLTEVKEEPHQEKDDFEVLDVPQQEVDGGKNCSSITDSTLRESLTGADYDWVDSPTFDEYDPELIAAKRRTAEAPPSPGGMTARFGTRWPTTLSRKWKTRREQRKLSLSESVQESTPSRSRASSLRAPSVLEGRAEIPMPLTPSESFIVETPEQLANSAADITSELSPDDAYPAAMTEEEPEVEEKLSRTPLLPPVMAPLQTSHHEEPVQSPLQSPKIVDTPTSPHSPPSTVYNSPMFPTAAVTTTATANVVGYPSPPLSTRPSMSSFHQQALPTPSSEIPPMLLTPSAPPDEWALRLGHANFTIHPEPYEAPEQPTVADVQRLRQDWETARRSYSRHLGRVAECYSTTSRTYALTEEKWATVDTAWRRAHDRALTAVAPSLSASQGPASAPPSPAAAPSAKTLDAEGDHPMPTTTPPAAGPAAATAAADASPPAAGPAVPVDEPPVEPIKLPPLNGPESQGKFPSIGDRGIVGPMQRVSPRAPPSPPPRPSRKRAFWKFLQGVFPLPPMGRAG